MKRLPAWLDENKWFVLACLFLAVNVYGVARLRPDPGAFVPGVAIAEATEAIAATPAPQPTPAPSNAPPASPSAPAAPTPLTLTHFTVHSPSFEKPFVHARFSRRVDIGSLRRALRIEPAAGITVEEQHRWYDGYSYSIRGELRYAARYRMTIGRDVRAYDNEVLLDQEFTREFTVPDAEPAIRISRQGRYLSPDGLMLLPLDSINLGTYTLMAARLPPRNLVQYAMREGRHYEHFYGDPGAGICVPTRSNTYFVAQERNHVVRHGAPLRDLLPENPRGAWLVTLDGNIQGEQQRRLLIVTDTGISVRQSERELLVWANSIHTLEPVADALAQVWSDSSELLAEGRTDPDGLAVIALPPPSPEAPSASLPFLVTVQKDGDLSYLNVRDAPLPRAANDATRPYAGSEYEAFVYTDRGIYRPGEQAHVRAVLRGERFEIPGRFPIELRTLYPDGRLHSRRQAMLSELGTAEFDIPWADHDATGLYRILAQTPGAAKAMGETLIAVEEFAPPRMAVKLMPDREAYAIGETARIEVEAQYLYGAPASGNPTTLRLEVRPAPFLSAALPDYTFGNAEKSLAPVSRQLGAGRLDVEGRAVFSPVFDGRFNPPAMLRGLLMASVMDQGGRSVTAYHGIDLHPYSLYIGLRAGNLGGILPGETREIGLALANPDGSRLEAEHDLEVVLQSITWSFSVSEDSNGRYRFESVRILNSVDEKKMRTRPDGTAVCQVTPPSAGSYLLIVRHPSASSSVEFFAGGAHEQWQTRSMERPERLDMAWDKPFYREGETALLKVTAPFGGKALLTVEQDRVIHHESKSMTGNTVEFRIPVTTSFRPNAHAAVSVIREAKPDALLDTHRAHGSIPLLLDPAPSTLRVAIASPESIRPLSDLEFEIRVTDSDGNPCAAEVAVAAVDEGICMLTGFATPDPVGFFNALRKPGVTGADLYAMLLPEFETPLVDKRAHTGGDGSMTQLLRGRLNPVRSRRFKPVALWHRGVMTDEHGLAKIRFEIPEFSGALRLMAVAVADRRFGSAEHKLTVRRPFTLTASLPRFLAPGDSCLLAVDLHNADAGDGEARISLEADGLALSPTSVEAFSLTQGSRTTLVFTALAENMGNATLAVTATLNGETVVERIELPVRPPAPEITVSGIVGVPAGERQTIAPPDDWTPGSATLSATISGRALVGLKGGLDYLETYPYGCLEQTVSQTFPLLYLKDIPRFDDLYIGNPDPTIHKGIGRVLSMQKSNGAFSYWPETDAIYEWGSIHAMHFLAEARAKGYPVPDERMAAGRRYLESLLEQPVKSPDNPASEVWRTDAALRAHACHALAVAGLPRHDWTERLREQMRYLDYDSRLHLVMALAAGDRRRDAWNELQSIDRLPLPSIREDGYSLCSPARSASMKLMAWMELAPDDPRIPALARQVESFRRADGAWYTTQENASAMIALARYMRHSGQQPAEFTGWIEQDNNRIPLVSRGGETHEAARAIALDDAPFTVVNDGPGVLYCAWRARGIPGQKRLPEDDHGFAIRRHLCTLEEHPIDDLIVRQGDLLVVRLTIDTQGRRIDNLVIDDLLPAGLEIENPNLKTAEIVEWAKTRSNLPIRHLEMRDDRLVVFAEAFEGVREFCYAVRAVTPGTYILPAVSAFAMYDPEISSRHGGCVLGVLEPIAPQDIP